MLAWLSLSSWAPLARAWVETTVSSVNVTLDVERDGTAVVAHEMLVRVRGGPMKEIVLEGVDSDAEPLPDATVTLAKSGRAAGQPIPLTVTVADERLVAKVELKKGLRGGHYLFRVRYRSDFGKSGLFQPSGARAELRWSGPRLKDGIDSVRLLLRVPHGNGAPRLPDSEATGRTTAITEEVGGVFLSTFRQAEGKDELEVVRPHVAKGEQVVWRALVDPSAFDLKLAASAEARASKAVAPAEPPLALPGTSTRWALIAAAAALAFALLLFAKVRLLSRACAAHKAAPRAFVPMPLALRLVLSVALVAGAVLLGGWVDHPTLGGFCLLFTVALAVHLGPRGSASLRGPGRWVELTRTEAFAATKKGPAPPGAWLDAGAFRGFVCFALLLALFVGGAVWMFPVSPYRAVMVALSSVVLFPIFCTGRSSDLPPDAVAGARRLLEPLFRQLSKDQTLAVTPILRKVEGSDKSDEMRLRIAPQKPRRGFGAIEAGVDYEAGFSAWLPLPYVIVRVMDASPSFDAMPKGLFWTRGRTPDERVAIVRPRLPTRDNWLKLVRRLASALAEPVSPPVGPRPQTRPGPIPRQRPTKPAISAGSGASTAKASMQSSPAQAT